MLGCSWAAQGCNREGTLWALRLSMHLVCVARRAIAFTHRLDWVVACLPMDLCPASCESSDAIVLAISFRRRLRIRSREMRTPDVASSWSPEVCTRRRRQGTSASPPVLSRRSSVPVVVVFVFSFFLFSLFIYWEALFGPASPPPTRPRQGRRARRRRIPAPRPARLHSRERCASRSHFATATGSEVLPPQVWRHP
jgi:hypothetical protein